jgi:hypothetical protein
MLPSADSATDGAEFRGRTRPPIPSTNATSDGEVGPTMVHLIKFEDNAASAHLSSVDTRRTCRIVLVVTPRWMTEMDDEIAIIRSDRPVGYGVRVPGASVLQ